MTRIPNPPPPDGVRKPDPPPAPPPPHEVVQRRDRLRDEFAMAALTGILSGGTVFSRESSLFGSETLAEMAYHCADAMIREREKR